MEGGREGGGGRGGGSEEGKRENGEREGGGVHAYCNDNFMCQPRISIPCFCPILNEAFYSSLVSPVQSHIPVPCSSANPVQQLEIPYIILAAT